MIRTRDHAWLPGQGNGIKSQMRPQHARNRRTFGANRSCPARKTEGCPNNTTRQTRTDPHPGWGAYSGAAAAAEERAKISTRPQATRLPTTGGQGRTLRQLPASPRRRHCRRPRPMFRSRLPQRAAPALKRSAPAGHTRSANRLSNTLPSALTNRYTSFV